MDARTLLASTDDLSKGGVEQSVPSPLTDDIDVTAAVIQRQKSECT